MIKEMKVVNWNVSEDYVNTFWQQNIQQFWTDEEFPIQDDKNDWYELTKEQRTAYKQVLSGLTGLDTHQATEGMPLISLHVEDYRKRAVLSFMSMMEHIHAKSYSTIFTTLLTGEEANYMLDVWATSNERLKFKASTISKYYVRLQKKKVTNYELYMAMAASVLLESYLFYSGFYYPLYLAGQGKMTSSGEVIRKILLDESIHGLYVGNLAQEVYAKLTAAEQQKAYRELTRITKRLYKNEEKYTAEIYDPINLTEDVLRYVKYNANKAFANLGFEAIYKHEPFSAIVENGISTGTKHHDFFSKKGDGYVIATNVEHLTDDDFIFAGRAV